MIRFLLYCIICVVVTHMSTISMLVSHWKNNTNTTIDDNEKFATMMTERPTTKRHWRRRAYFVVNGSVCMRVRLLRLSPRFHIVYYYYYYSSCQAAAAAAAAATT